MKTSKLLFVGLLTFVLASCSGDKSEEKVSKEAMPAESSAPMEKAAEVEISGTIDHSRDEMEFMLRRSLAGVDRMIEQYTADGYETADLEESKAQISSELDKFMSGS